MGKGVLRRDALRLGVSTVLALSGAMALAEGLAGRTVRIGNLEFDVVNPGDTGTPDAYIDPNATGTPLIVVPKRKLDAQLTDNFTLGEVARICDPHLLGETGVETLEHNGKVYHVFMRLDPKLVEGLQTLRKVYGGPLTVTSCFRDVFYNDRVGGSKRSRHVSGQASDVKAEDVAKLYKLADEQFKEGGVGNYPGRFVHVDTRGERARWTG